MICLHSWDTFIYFILPIKEIKRENLWSKAKIRLAGEEKISAFKVSRQWQFDKL